jgi:two-component system, cell cycle response regulator DivK
VKSQLSDNKFRGEGYLLAGRGGSSQLKNARRIVFNEVGIRYNSYKENQSDMRSRTILIVEDNPVNRKLLVAVLRPHGYRLLSAVDGEEAVAIAFLELPDLILMDLQLPKMNGFEATQRLKELPETAKIPVIALTAHAMPEERRLAQQAGFNGYITKPIDTRTFPDQIRAVFE